MSRLPLKMIGGGAYDGVAWGWGSKREGRLRWRERKGLDQTFWLPIDFFMMGETGRTLQRQALNFN